VSTVKRIVCLANSRKLNGRCIAGKEYESGRWVRPVSAREHEEVSEYERQYENGSDPRVMDILDVPLLEHRPKDYQRENWLLDHEHYWVRHGQVSWGELEELADPPGPLWSNDSSTYNGLNDKIALASVEGVESSLRLIHVEGVELAVFSPGEAFGNSKRRVQGRFRHDGVEYRLWVTDPTYERAFLERSDGEYPVGESYLTISLGEPYQGSTYKLIAAVIERDESQRR